MLTDYLQTYTRPFPRGFASSARPHQSLTVTRLCHLASRARAASRQRTDHSLAYNEVLLRDLVSQSDFSNSAWRFRQIREVIQFASSLVVGV